MDSPTASDRAMKRRLLSYFTHTTEFLLLWKLPALEFPLTESFAQARHEHLDALRRMLDLTARAGVAHDCFDAGAIERFLEYPERPDENSLGFWLLLFQEKDKRDLRRTTRNLPIFRVQADTRKAFLEQTVPVFRHVLADFYGFVALARAETYLETPQTPLPDPTDDVLALFGMIKAMAPPEAGLVDAPDLCRQMRKTWQQRGGDVEWQDATGQDALERAWKDLP